MQEIWKVGRFDRLDLRTLTSDETAVLLSATLAGSVDPDAAQRLWRLTRGNMLYLRNIVEQEIASGRIAQQHGFWRWSGDPIIPHDLVALVESRMGDLPAPVSDVVDALAVGEPIELSALTRITDPAAVEEADTRGLIRLEPVAGGVQVRVAHELYGEVRRNARRPPGCGGYAGWSPRSSPPPTSETTCGLSYAGPHCISIPTSRPMSTC